MTEYRYGDDKTVHASDYVNVEVNSVGQVVAVWFRCHPVLFKQSYADRTRSVQMEAMYSKQQPGIKAIVFDENAPGYKR